MLFQSAVAGLCALALILTIPACVRARIVLLSGVPLTLKTGVLAIKCPSLSSLTASGPPVTDVKIDSFMMASLVGARCDKCPVIFEAVASLLMNVNSASSARRTALFQSAELTAPSGLVRLVS